MYGNWPSCDTPRRKMKLQQLPASTPWSKRRSAAASPGPKHATPQKWKSVLGAVVQDDAETTSADRNIKWNMCGTHTCGCCAYGAHGGGVGALFAFRMPVYHRAAMAYGIYRQCMHQGGRRRAMCERQHAQAFAPLPQAKHPSPKQSCGAESKQQVVIRLPVPRLVRGPPAHGRPQHSRGPSKASTLVPTTRCRRLQIITRLRAVGGPSWPRGLDAPRASGPGQDPPWRSGPAAAPG